MLINKNIIKYTRGKPKEKFKENSIKIYLRQIDAMSLSDDKNDIKLQLSLIHDLLDELHMFVGIK